MICKHCGTELNPDAKFCLGCGAPAEAPAAPVPPFVPPVAPIPTVVVQNPAPQTMNEDSLPERFRPLSGWAYFGLQLLFAIPIVGFIFLIVFSFNGSNINRRNFARSYWCALLVFGVIALVVLIILAIFAGGLATAMR